MDASAIEYRDGPDVDLDQLERLKAGAGWKDRGRDVLQQQVRGARWVVSAWDGQRMVGFARAISDGVTNAYVSTVVVDEAYRGRGIGKQMLRRLMAGGEGIRWVLHARVEATPFYERLGFVPAANMLWRDRRGGS
jgi:ribosomal protein S18 acetylase RimI-like enzyme